MEIVNLLVMYLINSKKINSTASTFFENMLDSIIYELYLPETIQNANCEVLKHLNNLPDLKEGEDEETTNKNLKTIEKIYNELSSPAHPVNVAMFKMDTIEEIRIIEGKQ